MRTARSRGQLALLAHFNNYKFATALSAPAQHRQQLAPHQQPSPHRQLTQENSKDACSHITTLAHNKENHNKEHNNIKYSKGYLQHVGKLSYRLHKSRHGHNWPAPTQVCWGAYGRPQGLGGS